ncbi:MAG: IS110 family transposase [Ancrocorticia sp.]|uniref:IS110 family transposase n=1 Tax=Ancrocorticia sp. TaxID=2593684 RepID=UPI003F8E5270
MAIIRGSNGDREQYFAGIDWGGSFHQLCVIDSAGKSLIQKRYYHTAEGLAALEKTLKGFSGTVLMAIERSEGLLVEFLLTLGFPLYCVSPKISARARERYRIQAKKSDAFDAFVLADTLRHEHGYWRPLHIQSDALMQLRAAIRDRERIVWNQRDVENQLRAILQTYHPGPLHLFSSLDRDITLEFIKRYPTPERARHIGPARMEAFTRRHSYTGRVAPEVLLQRLREHSLSASPGTTRGKAFAAVRFAEELQLLNQHVRDFDKEIRVLLNAHPDTPIFTGFPGLGPVTAATLLAGMGEDRARYPTAAALLAETGLAPVTRASGRTRQVRFRYAANKRMRHAIDWWMFVAVREDPHWSGVLYEQARDNGQGHHRALRGIGTRWVRILWKCWHTHTQYDLTQHARRYEAIHNHENTIALLTDTNQEIKAAS